MIGIIVCGHGRFASGMKDAVELIAGKQPCFETVEFNVSDSVDDFEKKLKDKVKALEECEGIIIFTDMVEGTPFVESTKVYAQHKDRVVVLSGTNVGMLCETALSRKMVTNMKNLTTMAVQIGKDQAMKYTEE